MTGPHTKGPTVAQQLVGLAHDHYHVGRATTGEPYAHPRQGGTIARPLRGGPWSFRAELARLYHATTGKVPGQGALADALQVLEGEAQDGPPTDLATRVATSADGTILVDLGRPDEHHLHIGPDGWEIRTDHHGPAIFRRTRLTGPHPNPDPNATLDDLERLRDHTNITDDDWPLVICWAVAALLPHAPCPGLLLHGEQGTAKTTTGRHLRTVVDPSPVPLGAPPDDIRDWAAAANASRVVGIDNLSTIPAWFSDALCRIVTGEGVARRALYTDGDLHVIEMRRAVIITAIDAGSLRGDLAERLLPIELDPIDPARRLTDHDTDTRFAADLPAILGALATLTSRVLADRDAPAPALLPRMADFGRLVATVDRILGTRALDRYAGGLEQLNRAVVDSDPFAAGIRDWMADRDTWTGTATDLLRIIDTHHEGAKPKWWPADGAACSRRLKRTAPALRTEGIDVGWERGKSARLVRLERREMHGEPGDAIGDAIGRGDAIRVTGDAIENESRHPAMPMTAPDAQKGDAMTRSTPSLSVLAQEEKKEREGGGEIASSRHPNGDRPDPDAAPYALLDTWAYDGPHPAHLHITPDPEPEDATP